MPFLAVFLFYFLFPSSHAFRTIFRFSMIFTRLPNLVSCVPVTLTSFYRIPAYTFLRFFCHGFTAFTFHLSCFGLFGRSLARFLLYLSLPRSGFALLSHFLNRLPLFLFVSHRISAWIYLSFYRFPCDRWILSHIFSFQSGDMAVPRLIITWTCLFNIIHRIREWKINANDFECAIALPLSLPHSLCLCFNSSQHYRVPNDTNQMTNLRTLWLFFFVFILKNLSLSLISKHFFSAGIFLFVNFISETFLFSLCIWVIGAVTRLFKCRQNPITEHMFCLMLFKQMAKKSESLKRLDMFFRRLVVVFFLYSVSFCTPESIVWRNRKKKREKK